MLLRLKEMNPLASVSVVSQSEAENLAQFALVASTGLASKQADQLDAECLAANKPHINFDSAGLYAFMLVNLGPKYEYTVKDKKEHMEYVPIQRIFASRWSNPKTFPTRQYHKVPDLFFAICALRAMDDKAAEESIDAAKRIKQDGAESANAAFTARAENVLSKLQRDRALPYDLNTSSIVSMMSALVKKHQFSPTCAVLGGLVGQEVIKVLGRKDAPILNCMFFDGSYGAAIVKKLGHDE